MRERIPLQANGYPDELMFSLPSRPLWAEQSAAADGHQRASQQSDGRVGWPRLSVGVGWNERQGRSRSRRRRARDDHEDQERERFGVRNVVRQRRMDLRKRPERKRSADRQFHRSKPRHAATVIDTGNSGLQAASRCERIDTPETARNGAKATATTKHAANSRFSRPAPMVS